MIQAQLKFRKPKILLPIKKKIPGLVIKFHKTVNSRSVMSMCMLISANNENKIIFARSEEINKSGISTNNHDDDEGILKNSMIKYIT